MNARKIDSNTFGALMIADREGLVRLRNGSRTRVTGAGVGAGPSLGPVGGIAWDDGANRVAVLSRTRIRLVATNSGDRTELVLSPPITTSDAIALDDDLAYVAARNGDVYRVDITTGATTILSPASANASFPSAIRVIEGVPLVHYRHAIEAINTTTGARTVISKSSAPQVGSGPTLGFGGILRDPSRPNSLLVSTPSHVLRVDLFTGDRTVISGDGVGQGPAMEPPLAIAPISGGAAALQPSGILRVDATTGDRTFLLDDSVGSGFSIDAPGVLDLAVDGSRRVLVLDQRANLLSVDLATGERTLLPVFAGDVKRMTCHPETGDMYFLTFDSQVFRFDPDTGVRTEVSGNTVGAGAALTGAGDFSHGPRPGTLIVSDFGSGLLEVDIGTGFRSVLRPAPNFAGTDYSGPDGLAADDATLFMATRGDDVVFEVDAVGDYTLLADLASALGDEVADAVYAPSDNRVYVAGEALGRIMRVLPGTGAADVVAGDGPLLDKAMRIDASPQRAIAYVIDDLGWLHAVDLVTGQRVLVAR